MIGFIIDTEFVWGFQARVAGLSRTSPSFYYPPPTTFLGALAEAIAKAEKVGEERGKEIIPKLSENLLAIGVRPVNCVPVKYEDINRVIMISKKTSKRLGRNVLFPHPGDLEASFDSPARGKTILSSLNDDPPIIRWFLVFKDNTIRLDRERLLLGEEQFWKIHRLGSKESRVSVINVLRVSELDVKSDDVVTGYSFPITMSISIVDSRGRWEYEVYVNPFDVKRYDERENPVTNYIAGRKALPFKIPILLTTLRQPVCRIKLAKGAIAYGFKNEVVMGWAG